MTVGYRPNPLRRRLTEGGIGVIALGPNSSDICDFLGQFGFDAAFIDFEHGGYSWRELADISRCCDLWDMGTVVRVSKLDEALILRALDLGATGIVVPHVISVEDAERAARACRYPPHGCRGVAGNRRVYGADNYFARANEEVQCIALIEDAAALDNLDGLLKVEGIDVFQVAPSDLASSMGYTGEPTHPEVRKAIEHALKAIASAGRITGTVVDDANVAHYIEIGARCLSVMWPRWVASGAQAFLDGVRHSSNEGK